MVKVKEFCCGFTLRTGTLILAWGVLIWNCIAFLTHLGYLIILFRTNKTYYPPSTSNKSSSESNPYILIFLLIEAIIAIAISIVAIWAVQKIQKRVRYLNGLFWYFCYAAVIYAIDATLEIFNLTLGEDLTEDPILEFGVDIRKYKVLTFLINSFIIALGLYFALVVKSHQDYVLKNEIQRDDFEAPNQTNDRLHE